MPRQHARPQPPFQLAANADAEVARFQAEHDRIGGDAAIPLHQRHVRGRGRGRDNSVRKEPFSKAAGISIGGISASRAIASVSLRRTVPQRRLSRPRPGQRAVLGRFPQLLRRAQNLRRLLLQARHSGVP